LVARRLGNVQIEHAPALTVLERYDRPEVLHYVDPPYYDPTADLQSRYAHPMTEDDHRDLAEALHQLAGMVVLSGRPSALYAELYDGWRTVQRESLLDSGRLGAEVLWFNPAAAAALDQVRPRQEALAW
jgi:DNA adenine methylase